MVQVLGISGLIFQLINDNFEERTLNGSPQGGAIQLGPAYDRVVCVASCCGMSTATILFLYFIPTPSFIP